MPLPTGTMTSTPPKQLAAQPSPQGSPGYLSSRSANALISDLRPTTLLPDSLLHLNLLLDELLRLLVTSSGSIDPSDVKRRGVPAVFGGQASAPPLPGSQHQHRPSVASVTSGSQALGREVIGEAELELRAWRERRLKAIKKKAAAKGQQVPEDSRIPTDGFGRDRRGLRKDANIEIFPSELAVEMLRCKIIGYSTLASSAADPSEDKLHSDCWTAAGGSLSEDIVAPAALYFTAILEHICEHVLTNVGRVIARDSTSSRASLQDLYIALCEDESIWGVFKNMKAKTEIEAGLRTGEQQPASSRPSTVNRRSSRVPVPSLAAADLTELGTRTVSRSSDVQMTSSGGISSTPVISEQTMKKSSFPGRASMDGAGATALALARSVKPGKSSGGSIKGHQRSSSVLSDTTKGMLGAIYDDEPASSSGQPNSAGTRSSMQTDRLTVEDDFDKLLKSGSTMKVSLTPSRLKTYEHGKSPEMAQGPFARAANKLQGKAPAGSPVGVVKSLNRAPSLNNSSVLSSPSMSTHTSPSGRMKLVPRDGAQDDDEEDILDSPGLAVKKRETLMDVLSSDPPWGQQARGGGAPIIRMKTPSNPNSPSVDGGASPALSSPHLGVPLGAPLKRTHSPSRLQTQRSASDLNDLDEEDEGPGSRRGSAAKTATQDLADFFSSTAPPQAVNRSSVDGGRVPERKNSRFKSFVSKITGNNDSKGQDDLLTTADLNEGTVRRGSGGDIARQKSFSREPPSAYKGPNAGSSMQRRGSEASNRSKHSLNRGPSRAEDVAAVNHVSLAEPTSMRPLGDAKIEDEYVGPSTIKDGAVVNGDRRISAAPFSNGIPMEAVAAAGVLAGGAAVTAALVARKSRGVEHEQEDEENGHAESVAVAHLKAINNTVGSPSSNYEDSTADHTPASLTPASPAVEEPVVPASVEPVEEPSEEPSKEDEEVKADPEPVPQIALSQVAALRRLLRHASSADECRLLVNSMLASWGVPGDDATEFEQTPESRLTTWLLTGGEAPPRSPPSMMRRQEEVEEPSKAEEAAEIPARTGSKLSLGMSEESVPPHVSEMQAME